MSWQTCAFLIPFPREKTRVEDEDSLVQNGVSLQLQMTIVLTGNTGDKIISLPNVN